MKKIIITTLISIAFISLLLSANVKPPEREQQPVSITTTIFMTEKENITTEPVTQPITTTSITTKMVQTTASEKTITTTPPVTEQTTAITTTQPIPIATATTTPKNGTIEGDMIWVQGFGWIEYEGGGGIGYYDAEMYTNGNKIGYFG